MKTQNQPRKKRRWLSGCLVVLGTVSLMIAIAWLLMEGLSDRSTDAMRAKGYPTSLAELDAWYVAPPDGENAADFYLAAGKRISNSTFAELDDVPVVGLADYPPLGTLMPVDMRTTVAGFLEHQSASYGLIDEAQEFEGSRYPMSYVTSPSSTPHIKFVRSAYRGQFVRTLYHNGHDDPEIVLREFVKMVHLARSLGYEPSLISSLVYGVLVQGTGRAAERIINENVFSDDQLARIDRSLESLLHDDALLRALVGERCIVESGAGLPIQVPIVGGYLRQELSASLGDFVEMAEDGAIIPLENYEDNYSIFRPYSQLVAPAITGAVEGYWRRRAQILALQAAISVQRYRITNPGIPPDLEALPIAIREAWPSDPFDEKSFRYMPYEDGFIVYSIGPDFTDDGGLPESADPSFHIENALPDVVVRILR